MVEGISKKIYLELEAPTEEDSRSGQKRILDGLLEQGLEAKMTGRVLRKIYPLCEKAKWKLTVSLAWDGTGWMAVDLEEGNQEEAHYGAAIDLGSTTVVGRIMDCRTGSCVAETSEFNGQISYGTDILTRIFYCKDKPEALEELRLATVRSIEKVMEELEARAGISAGSCIQMVVSGNTTMIHFLIGMDPFCIFSTPYAVRADQPGFLPAWELGLPVKGYVFCFPGKSNYLGGDIISGMIDTQLYKSDTVQAFFDIGTNGELVIGNRDFLLCGAGAAGPALEGGVVRTGMRAAEGAVDRVRIEDETSAQRREYTEAIEYTEVAEHTEGTGHTKDTGHTKGTGHTEEREDTGEQRIDIHVIGEGSAQGICGSGIVDLIAELFLHGWIDLRGKFVPEKSPLIQEKDGMYAVEYAPGLFFYQEDIEEFIRTKAAAHTMVECMLRESGFSMKDISRFYVAGAFGKHVSKESAIAIGMYPDMDRDRIINAGNSSLEGAGKLLLDRTLLDDLEEILEKMIYIQFGAVEDFLQLMVAAQALPHTDLERYPTVAKRLNR